MNPLTWLVQHRIESAHRRGHEWVFTFDPNASLVVSCLWHLIEDDRVRLTSEDDGQQFGLPEPIDANQELNRCICRARVEAVSLRENTLDLELRFSTGHLLQVIPDSSGYESWIAQGNDARYIAVGGGELVILTGQTG